MPGSTAGGTPAATGKEKWLPDMDLNHDKQIQSLLCYRYTIGQTSALKLRPGSVESRTLPAWIPCDNSRFVKGLFKPRHSIPPSLQFPPS